MLVLLLVTSISMAAPESGSTAAPESGSTTVRQGFWAEGLVGICGGRGSAVGWFLGILGFIITSVVAAWIAGGLLGAQDLFDKIGALAGQGGGKGFAWFLLVGTIWYIFSWGFPSGFGWWTLWIIILLLYLVIGGIIAELFSSLSGPHVWGA